MKALTDCTEYRRMGYMISCMISNIKNYDIAYDIIKIYDIMYDISMSYVISYMISYIKNSDIAYDIIYDGNFSLSFAIGIIPKTMILRMTRIS